MRFRLGEFRLGDKVRMISKSIYCGLDGSQVYKECRRIKQEYGYVVGFNGDPYSNPPNENHCIMVSWLPDLIKGGADYFAPHELELYLESVRPLSTITTGDMVRISIPRSSSHYFFDGAIGRVVSIRSLGRGVHFPIVVKIEETNHHIPNDWINSKMEYTFLDEEVEVIEANQNI